MKETKTKKATQTSTAVVTEKKAESGPYDLLEPVEEKVIRMHYGLSENDDKSLEYAVGASEDARMRVSLMEAGNIAELDGDVPVVEGVSREVLNEFVKGLDV